MSLMTIRSSAAENVRSISASAGRTTSLTRADPVNGGCLLRRSPPEDIVG